MQTETAVDPTTANSGKTRVVHVFALLAMASAVAVSLIVISGAAVRLTGSGLGCPDWPSCYQHSIGPAANIHPLIEFGNRLVTFLLVIIVGVTTVAAHLRRPFRRDLALLSWGLVAGVLGQAVLGGIVVYTKLNPYLVMGHFAFSLLVVADAVVLVHRARRDYNASGVALVPVAMRRATALLLVALSLVVIAGTAATGAGPHAGGFNGQQIAKRIPVALRSVVELHAATALLFIGLTIGIVIGIEALGSAPVIRQISRRLLVVSVVQGIIGALQYGTHLPGLLVELHIVGATALTIGTVRFALATVHHPFDPLAVPSRASKLTTS